MDKMKSCVITAMMLLETMGDFPDCPLSLSDDELANLAHSVLQVGFSGCHSVPNAKEQLEKLSADCECTFDDFILNAPIASSV
jgi:hypothetical protein